MRSKDSLQELVNNSNLQTEKPEIKVLVISSCQHTTKEITLELMNSFVGASITYSPTFTLAKLLLTKRNFDLIVSNSIMPDGRVQILQDILNTKATPPPLVVIGNVKSTNGEMLGVSGYLFSCLRKLDQPVLRKHLRIASVENLNGAKPQTDPIKSLGSDLRNDLNNPLQEIVAMVYVAKSQTASTEVTQQALDAISRAAKNLGSVVKEIEKKIRVAVAG